MFGNDFFVRIKRRLYAIESKAKVERIVQEIYLCTILEACIKVD